MRPNFLTLTCCCLTAAFCGAPGRCETPAPAAQRSLDVSPERLASFRRALLEFGGLAPGEAGAWGLHPSARYEAPPLMAPASPEEADDLRVPWGPAQRAAIAHEQLLIEGREDDFVDAAEKWVARKVKGSDAAGRSRGARLAPKFAWDGGPIVGARKGPFSAMVGEDQWQLRYTRPLKRPGWRLRVSAGEEDGDGRVSFSVGRSLFHATR